MRIKRFLATTLSTALIAGIIFTGCGDTNEATTEATTATTVATEATTESTEATTEATTEDTTEATTEVTTADTGSTGVVGGDDSNADLGFYEGNYNDTYSGRAYATVEKNDDDTLHILVHWGGSATEYAQWEMNATVDNGVLVYSDSKKTNCTTADDEAGETVEVVYENGTGYFNDENGSLYWYGSEDESCRDCVFERIPTEE